MLHINMLISSNSYQLQIQAGIWALLLKHLLEFHFSKLPNSHDSHITYSASTSSKGSAAISLQSVRYFEAIVTACNLLCLEWLASSAVLIQWAQTNLMMFYKMWTELNRGWTPCEITRDYDIPLCFVFVDYRRVCHSGISGTDSTVSQFNPTGSIV